MESDMPQGTVTGPSPENPTLAPMPKNPFRQRWWQLPKTVYIALAAMVIISIGSTAYLFLAPSGLFNLQSGKISDNQKTSLESMYGPSNTPTPTTASSVILVDGPTPTGRTIGSPTPTPDVTVAWLTYKNYAYGYTFKYPSDWTVTDMGNLEPKIPSYLTINPSSVATPSTALTMTVGSSTRTFDEEVALRSSTHTSLMINGMTASFTEEKDSGGNIKYNVVLKGTKYTYILVGKSAYYSIFTPFYSTFKLL